MKELASGCGKNRERSLPDNWMEPLVQRVGQPESSETKLGDASPVMRARIERFVEQRAV